jgi:hypothetical protein
MIVHRSDTHIKFSFDRKEWSISNGDAVRAFIDDLKARVPNDQRDYNSSTNEWKITTGFASIVEELREKHFIDQRQGALF